MKPRTLTSRIGFDRIPERMGEDFQILHRTTCPGCGCQMQVTTEQLGNLCPYCDPDLRAEWENLEI